MEWLPATIQRLRGLWDEGHSTAECARRLGVSKNAVVGKAHRLDLPARPSPIKRDGPGAPPRVRQRSRVTTLPPLSSVVVAPQPKPAPVAPPVQARPQGCDVSNPPPRRPIVWAHGARRVSAAPQVFPPSRVKPAALPDAPAFTKCTWPLWGSRERPTHQYCDAPTRDGERGCPEDGRWCAKHRRLGYSAKAQEAAQYLARWGNAA